MLRVSTIVMERRIRAGSQMFANAMKDVNWIRTTESPVVRRGGLERGGEEGRDVVSVTVG